MVVTETHFPDLTLAQRGKVRDIYDLGDSLLMVASDRLSAFDVILAEPIPDKGKVLTRISAFWFEMMRPLIPNQILSVNVADFPSRCREYADLLQDRSMWVKKATPLPIECVVRGYISGSGWKSYQTDGTVCGIALPQGLKESEQLPEPIFTPSTKAPQGQHDENIPFERAAELIGGELAEKVRNLSLAIYQKGADYARTRGIIIADTKFEFGLIDDELVLIDELLTPDSSRFWPLDRYQPGGSQPSFDKQYVRDYLNGLDWDHQPPPPPLPDAVIENTRARYLEALKRLTGHAL